MTINLISKAFLAEITEKAMEMTLSLGINKYFDCI